MIPEGAWVILDGDNTLWPIEYLYDEARQSLCRHLASEQITAEMVEHFQHEADRQLHKTMGYSRARFPQSFVETLTHFRGEPSDKEIETVRGLAETVFTRSVKPAEGVDQMLARLGTRFHLALLTAGDRDIQETRLNDFGRSRHFAAQRIVPVKTAKVMAQLIEELNVCRRVSWVVGDSVKSDIEPALANNLSAVLVTHPNWARVEGQVPSAPAGYFVASDLTEAAQIITAQCPLL